jgi:hypothetical protein
MNDVRDESLRAVLDQEATRIESAPIDRLSEVLRRGSRHRAIRFTSIAAAVAIFAGAVSWAGLQNEGRETIPANIDDWDTFASLEENGWTVQVPSSWRVQVLPACSNAPERLGVVVNNVDFEFLNRDGLVPACAEGFVFDGFPRSGVAFAFVPWRSTDGLLIRRPDTLLPLSLDLLTEVRTNTDGLEKRSEFVWLGSPFGVVRRWTGSEASVRDVAALDRMLSSFEVRGAPRWVDGDAKSLGDLKVSFVRPETWSFAGYPHAIVIDAPTPILRLRSPRIRGDGCELIGEPWMTALGVGRFDDYGVEIVVSDASDSWGPPDLPTRPATLRLGDASSRRSVMCGGASIRVLTFGFQEAGTPIFIHALATEAVYREQPEMLLHILNSIRIEEA